jgi:hypothetical protein
MFDTRQTPTAADGHELPFEFTECHTADTRQTCALPSVKVVTPFAECQTLSLGKLKFFFGF